MKCFHVHVAVSDLDQSTRFYSTMFGAPPTLQKPDCAKWMLHEPRLNFAISVRAGALGVNHLGFQAESADTSIAAKKGAECCYAKSDKYWVKGPTGIAWESFRSLDTIPFYGEPSDKKAEGAEVVTTSGCSTACCPTIETKVDVATAKASAKACCNG